MKKVLLLLAIVFSVTIANAQIITEQDFAAIDMSQFDTNGDGKIKDDEAALAIKDLYGLDKNNSITRVTVIDSIPKSKDQIYVAVNDWFVRSFNDGKSVIQLNDKELGTIIGKGHISNMGNTLSFASSADISADVIIRVDMKDGRMRITTSIQKYEMEKGTGVLGALAGGPAAYQKVHQEFIPSECFPFTKKQKKEGAKAFVKSHIYSLIVTNKLRDAVLNGLTGGEEDW
ncbi:DUF4468 domain-containing protein [uncultured Duncaniella sp.]|jgi:hypothetical protein|uniref:DUF4468 domain-containing protein n=1 Tax=uncultured Duncaniella sp. TaxID=2768039 RepID=UPI0025AF0776|nr:DUF4468 domain-containing protein [uncultured Duncaniella sp.]